MISQELSGTNLNALALERDSVREQTMLLGLAGPALLLVLVLVIAPGLWLVGLSFVGEHGLSLEHYARLISEPSYRRIFQTTFEIAFIVTGLSIVLGYPLAYFISQLRPRAAAFCLLFVILPLWTSVLVRTYAWLVLLQRKGLINETLIGLGVIDEPLRLVNNYTGTVIGMVHVLIPFLILPLYSVMRGIDPNYMKAAASLGASPARAFWAVFFPLALLGLLGGAVLVFVLSLGFYITPELLGGGKVMMVSMKIQQNAALYFNWGAASALGVVVLVLTMGAFWGLGKMFPLERLFGGK